MNDWAEFYPAAWKLETIHVFATRSIQVLTLEHQHQFGIYRGFWRGRGW